MGWLNCPPSLLSKACLATYKFKLFLEKLASVHHRILSDGKEFQLRSDEQRSLPDAEGRIRAAAYYHLGVEVEGNVLNGIFVTL